MRWLKFALLLGPVAIGTMFLAFWTTILLMPLWRRVEADYGIESVGHSGPAEWCFLLVFAILMVPALYLSWRSCRLRPPGA